MPRWQRMYGYGMTLVIALCVLAQLIWLPDPIRIGSWYWIDLLDVLVYALLGPPVLWFLGAYLGFRAARRETKALLGRPRRRRRIRGYSLLLFADVMRRGMIMAASAGAVLVIALMLIEMKLSLSLLLAAGVLLGGTWLLAVWDMASREREIRGGVPWRSLLQLGASATLLALLFWPTSSLVTYPGLTMNMNRYALVEGGTPKGEITGVLVFDRPAFPADWLYAELFPHYVFRPIAGLGMSLGSYETLVRDMKREADELGAAVAFEAAGVGQGAVSYGARVTQVQVGGPAYGQLHPGDVIVELNGLPVATVLDLTDRMRLVLPGETASVTIQRGGGRQTFELETVQHPSDESRAAVGIEVVNALQLDLPRDVVFGSYFAHEGGPSHGAALALTLTDQLTPGGVTYGNRVVVTGTIAADGAIGRIGGIRQKAFAAERTGANVFFVPRGQELAAQEGARYLTIVPVDNLAQILEWLKQHPR
ncbi:PDZ domain-containing protein [Paenibacillus sp. IB182496]|uniref:PDZ domain-containing protein n=1 Tax=Paenibacillus sabuli TaxID=2772509 RepID=A0A927GQZ1_9BACL|nr:PDZ domain-containing protein [Paenibacillus sabuli]MBD2844771.1 PDZ domain-containing protein [Paenibacillus sabuli]